MSLRQALMVFLALTLVCVLHMEHTDDLRALNYRIEKLEAEVRHLNLQDSLIHEHYKRCSFIGKEQIEVGHDNYLRLKK